MEQLESGTLKKETIEKQYYLNIWKGEARRGATVPRLIKR
jgi:hypothetical protein